MKKTRLSQVSITGITDPRSWQPGSPPVPNKQCSYLLLSDAEPSQLYLLFRCCSIRKTVEAVVVLVNPAHCSAHLDHSLLHCTLGPFPLDSLPMEELQEFRTQWEKAGVTHPESKFHLHPQINPKM